MWQELFTLIALVFILEGVLPTASPQVQRKVWEHMLQRGDNYLRRMGMFSMLFGLFLLYLVR